MALELINYVKFEKFEKLDSFEKSDSIKAKLAKASDAKLPGFHFVKR